jgi:hypothetical protein
MTLRMQGFSGSAQVSTVYFSSLQPDAASVTYNNRQSTAELRRMRATTVCT